MAFPTLRSRPNATSSTPISGKPNSSSYRPSDPKYTDTKEDTNPDGDDSPTRLSLLDVLRILGGLLVLSSTLSYFVTRESLFWNYRPAFTRPARVAAWLRGPLHLTDAQLSLYNGTDKALPILLALNGSIYDVSANPHMYGPGGSYHFFAGRDATRAFVTGCFDTDLNGDLRGVEEMFMPAEDDAGASANEGGRERKLRRERERRVARRQVRETVEGWEKMFAGGKDGKYFWVGGVNREVESGWEGWGELKELCEKARMGRPRRTAEELG